MRINWQVVAALGASAATLAVDDTTGIYQTTDSGQTWTLRYEDSQ